MKVLQLTLLAHVLGLATATRVNLFERAGCNADNCFRGVSVSSLLPSRSADCLAYMASSTLPKYAAACTSMARYASACSCIGATVATGTTASTTSSSTSTSTTSTTSSTTSPSPAQITVTSTQTLVSTVTNTVTSIQTALTTVTNTQKVDTTATNTETSTATFVQTVSVTVTNTQFLNTTATQTFLTTSTDLEQATVTSTQTIQTTATNLQTTNTTFTNIFSTTFTSTSTSTQLFTASSTVTVTSTAIVAVATPVTGTCPIRGASFYFLDQHQVNGGYIQGDDGFGTKTNNYYGGFLARVVSGADSGKWLQDKTDDSGFIGLTGDKSQATTYNMVSSYVVSVKHPGNQIMCTTGGFVSFGADFGGAASCAVTSAPAGSSAADGRIGMLTCYQPGSPSKVGTFSMWASQNLCFTGPDQEMVPSFLQEVVSIAVFPANCPS